MECSAITFRIIDPSTSSFTITADIAQPLFKAKDTAFLQRGAYRGVFL
jgi:hypothetical protein